MTDFISVEEAEMNTGDLAASSRPDRRFLDFSLNGLSLVSLFGGAGYDGLISCLWIDNAAAAPASADAAQRLLGRRSGDAPDGTVSMYVCAACGDLGCGALTARVELHEDLVTWSDWGYRTDRVGDDSWEVPPDIDGIPVRDFVFERDDYERVMIDAIERIGRAPEAESLPFQGRKHRWRRRV